MKNTPWLMKLSLMLMISTASVSIAIERHWPLWSAWVMCFVFSGVVAAVGTYLDKRL